MYRVTIQSKEHDGKPTGIVWRSYPLLTINEARAIARKFYADMCAHILSCEDTYTLTTIRALHISDLRKGNNIAYEYIRHNKGNLVCADWNDTYVITIYEVKS
jgi:hypothetical protein